MDYLKELTYQLKGKINKTNKYNLNFEERSFRFLSVKDYKGYSVQIEDFVSLYRVSIRVDSEFAFSINNPDRVLLLNKEIEVVGFQPKIYISFSDESPLEDKSFNRCWPLFSRIVSNIDLSNNESIFVHRDYIRLGLKPNRNLIETIDHIIELIHSCKEVFKINSKNPLYLKNIPENLRFLMPMIKKWSISDDQERSIIIEQMSKRQINNLVNSVKPVMSEINQFLNSFGEKPLSDEAIGIGNLAELVTELSMNE